MISTKLVPSDYGLIYLSNFENGISYYKWDQDIINYLKSRVHPNEILEKLKSKELVTSINYEGVKHYVLTESGLSYADMLRDGIEPVFRRIEEIQESLKEKGFVFEDIELKLPVCLFKQSRRIYKIILDRESNGENTLRIFLPSDINRAFNEIEITLKSLFETSYLEDLLIANYNLLIKLS